MAKIDNLTRDVLAAKAAGYGSSYGRYIADHGHTSKPAQNETQKKTAICPLCGKQFIPKDRWPSKYCGAVCIEKAHQKQKDAAKKKRLAKLAKETDCAASPV